jgi:hypothetical protein
MELRFLNWLKQQWQSVEKELQWIIVMRGRTGVETIGDYENRCTKLVIEEGKLKQAIENEILLQENTKNCQQELILPQYEAVQIIENQLFEYYNFRAKASIDAVSNYDILIEKLNKERNLILNSVIRIKKLYIFILVSPRNQVEQNIPANTCHHLCANRYHQHFASYRPFRGELPIYRLIRDNHLATIEHLHYDSWHHNRTYITQVVDNHIVITVVDPLSLGTDNGELLNTHFDRNQKTRILIPTCEKDIIINSAMSDYATERIRTTFANTDTRYVASNVVNELYHHDRSPVECFQRELTDTIRHLRNRGMPRYANNPSDMT